jgi:hypothetical protein
MNTIIGKDKAAKFILFRCDSDLLLPKLSEVKKTLGCKTASFYKSSGHYSNEINHMSHLLDVITNGLTPASELKNFFMRRRTPYMTNVLRLDPDTKRNLFFDLKYSDYIVDHLFLTNESINDLELLCSSAFDLIKKVNLVADLIEQVDEFHNLLNKRKKIDLTVEQATRLLNSDCFKNFGNDAFKFAESKFSIWYKKAKWQDEMFSEKDNS